MFHSFLQKKEDATELQQQSSALKADTDKAEAAAKAAEKERDALLVTIGNLVHDSVPVSDDEVGCSCCSVRRTFEVHWYILAVKCAHNLSAWQHLPTGMPAVSYNISACLAAAGHFVYSKQNDSASVKHDEVDCHCCCA